MKRHDTEKMITKDELSPLLSPENADRLTDEYGQSAVSAAWELFCEGEVKAASFLCRAAKKKQFREQIVSLASTRDFAELYSALRSSDNKLRKNTARLAGELALPEFDEQLINALSRETVRMVIPSIILALGAVGTDKARDALTAYEVAPAADESEKKHEREERDALTKALASFSKGKRHVFTRYEKIPALRLICARGMGKYVAQDCTLADIDVVSYADSSVIVKGTDLERLMNVRSFREILIPVCKADEYARARELILDILDNTHEKTDEPYRYRIEYKGTGNRKAEIQRLGALLSCPRMVNTVSDYEVEVRAEENGDIKLRLFTHPDVRFAYRKCALPASIAPANAASVMSFVREFLRPDAVVLDMCCGSGTMLFERELAMPCREIIGVDISQKAIDAARENARAAKSQAVFVKKDLRHFYVREKTDEIISNLPFGSRVGTHTDNRDLYGDIARKAKNEWLNDGGICVLYTTECRLLKEIMEEAGFSLLKETKTDAGGLLPVVMVFKRQ